MIHNIRPVYCEFHETKIQAQKNPTRGKLGQVGAG